MLEARTGLRAAVGVATVGVLLTGVAAIALPLVPARTAGAQQLTAVGRAPATTPSTLAPLDDLQPTWVDEPPVEPPSSDAVSSDAVAAAAVPVRSTAPVRAAATKTPAPKAAPKPARASRGATPVAVITSSGSLVGKANGPDIEGYPRYEGQSTCDPTDKPGAIALRSVLLAHYKGSANYGISRACGSDRSEHYEGRAFDWGVNVNNPSQKAAADDFIAQLMATDSYGHKAALARRMGIMYVIWNQQIWMVGPDTTWKPYTGSSPHTDHVHISMSWAGARMETSFWSGSVVPGLPGDALPDSGQGRRPSTTTPTTPTTRPPRTTTTTVRPPRTTSTTVRPTTTTVRPTTTTVKPTTTTVKPTTTTVKPPTTSTTIPSG